jgi:hypothetical protein
MSAPALAYNADKRNVSLYRVSLFAYQFCRTLNRPVQELVKEWLSTCLKILKTTTHMEAIDGLRGVGAPPFVKFDSFLRVS